MGHILTLTAADGFKLSAYRADAAGKPKGALVVIQEIFGVNIHIRNVCDGFAKDGYTAIAPALFDRAQRGVELGYTPDDIARGREIRGKLDWDGVLKDVSAAIANVASVGKVGVVGYCFGGTVAWLAATRLPGVASAVGYYGGQIVQFKDEKSKVPVMLHFGDKDQSIPMADVDAIKAAQPAVPVWVYPGAGHGFSCDHRPSFHKDSFETARLRTLDFFAQTLS
ncbi:MAG TPA: dienelactone hydrolase family protein [Alphaproteobacteria bacterium]|nr:dienelactone hydrolase family protein [Alphaproteobacteria bacterium]